MPYKSDDVIRPTASDTGNPTTMPSAINNRPSRSTIHVTLVTPAPRAIRTPISLVR
jgi:hypothetical protein